MDRGKFLTKDEGRVLSEVIYEKYRTRREFCEKIGFHESEFSRITNGKQSISATKALAVYGHFNKDPRLKSLGDFSMESDLIAPMKKIYQNIALLYINELGYQIREKGICDGKIIGLAITGSFKGFDIISEV